MIRSAIRSTPILLASALALALAGCGEKEETTFEPGATDLSGSELKVEPQRPGEVPVNVPEVPMKAVPDASASASASASPTPTSE
ncbi:MAG: hypothetical protein WA842_05270 [Croceibacterium sp.]